MRSLQLAAVAAGFSLFAHAASAGVVTLTLTGSLSKGFDESGMFGAAGSDLAGATFTAVSVFDTSLGQVGSTLNTNSIVGGTVFGGASPGHASLTINGTTVNLTGDYLAYLNKGPTTVSSDFEDRVIVSNIATYGALFSGVSYGDFPHSFDLATPFHANCAGFDLCTGAFFFGQETELGPYHAYYTNSGTFNVATYDITTEGFPGTGGGVPEPATWAMMLLGFAAVGATLRDRRRQTA